MYFGIPMLIAQISDLHLVPAGALAYATVDTGALLQEALAAVLRLEPLPACVLLTGDLVEAGDAPAYARLRALLEVLPMPCYLLPGNHDDRGALCAEFHGDHWRHVATMPAGFVQYSVEDFAVRLIVLDTSVPGAGHGELCPQRLAWLAAALDAPPARPTVIAMHHPPFATGLAEMDRLALRAGGAALETLLWAHPEVERVVCGHVHRPIMRRFGGTLVCTSPATAHQVAFDLRPEAPAALVMEPPGLLLHLWCDGALVTHQVVARAAGPARPF